MNWTEYTWGLCGSQLGYVVSNFNDVCFSNSSFMKSIPSFIFGVFFFHFWSPSLGDMHRNTNSLQFGPIFTPTHCRALCPTALSTPSPPVHVHKPYIQHRSVIPPLATSLLKSCKRISLQRGTSKSLVLMTLFRVSL